MRSRKIAWLTALLLAVAATLYVSVAPAGARSGHKYRWDIVSIDFTTFTVSAGGIASARAIDGSKITLTGTGTFHSKGNAQSVTGGGEWTTFATDGTTETGSGSYEVTGFVSFVPAPGTGPFTNDDIAPVEDIRAGLLVVEIAYSDGSTGVLTVSCHLVGTPDSVFEGIVTSKGFVTYWNPEPPPAPPGDANRTAFHVLN